jgi:surface polysaccharide O-acyltransferase-like enzyme
MKTRILWLDGVRAFAIILVVLLHTVAPYLIQIDQIPNLYWDIGDLVDSFTRICVPLFFMISGYLFLGERSPKLKNYFHILAALGFYSVLALIYIKLYQGMDIRNLVINIWAEPVIYHLWFFYSLLIVYLVAGLISTRNLSLRAALIFSTLCFIVLNPRLSHLTQLVGIKLDSLFQIDGTIIFFILYAVIGSVLGRTDFSKGAILILVLSLLYVISSLLITFLTRQASFGAGKYIERYHDYNSILVFVGAVSIFTIFKAMDAKLKAVELPIRILAKYSLPIYGVHALFIDFLKRAGFRNFQQPFWDISFTFLATTAFSLMIAVLIKKFDKRSWVS